MGGSLARHQAALASPWLECSFGKPSRVLFRNLLLAPYRNGRGVGCGWLLRKSASRVLACLLICHVCTCTQEWRLTSICKVRARLPRALLTLWKRVPSFLGSSPLCTLGALSTRMLTLANVQTSTVERRRVRAREPADEVGGARRGSARCSKGSRFRLSLLVSCRCAYLECKVVCGLHACVGQKARRERGGQESMGGRS